jgi:CRISPR system Cascade subunit CasE
MKDQMMSNNHFATTLTLNRNDHVRLKITDSYSIHRIVYSLFEDIRSAEEKMCGERSGILYCDNIRNSLSRKILIISNREPVDQNFGAIETKTINENLFNYKNYRFSIKLNAVTRIENKKIPIKDDVEIIKWFIEKSSKHGFMVHEKYIELISHEIDVFTKNKNKVIINTALLQGFLQVSSKEVFRKSFVNGIGRAKAFGCGLLQISPIN